MDSNTTDVPRRDPAGGDPVGTAGLQGTADTGRGTGAESHTMTLSAERLLAVAQATPTEVVRISKHVVTEERTVNVQVQVRREELRVERLPAGSGRAGAAGVGRGAADGAPVLTLVLSEEVPEVVVRVVPRERVSVYVDRTTEQVAVTATLKHEELDIQTTGSADSIR